MSWRVEVQRRRMRSAQVYLKHNFRVGSQVKTKRIYLGPEGEAVRILGEMQTRPLEDERLLTCSGELILGKIADSLGLTRVLSRYTPSMKEARVMRDIIVLRALFNESKRGLVERRLPKSILGAEADVSYVEQVYRGMDHLYDHLDELLFGLAKNAVKKYRLDLRYLIIDGTGIQVYKDDETELIKFGYRSNGLPQLKLVLAVNTQHIPLIGRCYPGNSSDVTVFDDLITGLDAKYGELTSRAKKKYVIFDQANLNQKTVDHLRRYEKQQISFISLVRSGTRNKFIEQAYSKKLKLIYDKEKTPNNHTRIYGKHLKGKIYGKECSILVCYNPDIEKQKNKTLDRKLNQIREKVEELNQKDNPDPTEIKNWIAHHNLKTILHIQGKKKLQLIEEPIQLQERRKYHGYFVLFSNDLKLGTKMITLYKTRNIIEAGFKTLKTDLEITPEYHSKDQRIQTHIIMVVTGYLLLTLLRTILHKKGTSHSINTIKETLTTGYLTTGYYHLPTTEKKLKITKPAGFGKKLKKMLTAVQLKPPKFDIKVMPT